MLAWLGDDDVLVAGGVAGWLAKMLAVGCWLLLHDLAVVGVSCWLAVSTTAVAVALAGGKGPVLMVMDGWLVTMDGIDCSDRLSD